VFSGVPSDDQTGREPRPIICRYRGRLVVALFNITKSTDGQSNPFVNEATLTHIFARFRSVNFANSNEEFSSCEWYSTDAKPSSCNFSFISLACLIDATKIIALLND